MRLPDANQETGARVTPFDWRAHLSIARPDHWFKNVFMLPGVIVAASTVPSFSWTDVLQRTLVAAVALCLIASSYYTLNEILDAPFDKLHPTKHTRPIPSGRVNISVAWTQWLVLFLLGLAVGWIISSWFVATLMLLWVAACAYNIPPIRTKDKPYLDVLSESVNNPLRMVAGWFVVTSVTLPPASLLLSYWMIGAYFMALKRFAEFRHIADAPRAAAYRKSFAFYTEERLLVSIMFYGTASMLFFGAFCMRYRLELLLAFPLVALVMALYLHVALKPDSAAQNPERLYRERSLMSAVIGATLLMAVLLYVDIPVMHRLLSPTAPPQPNIPADTR
jgi:4-hydroxybenzoate polyprenyltransferase